MVLALLVLAGLADWVPARWTTSDVQSLELIAQTPINCLLLETQSWSAKFSSAASARGIAVLGVVRPGSDALESARRARDANLNGVVLEGEFAPGTAAKVREALAGPGLAVIELPPRRQMRLDGSDPVVGTYQGVWPGIQVQDDGHAAKAAPSGGPWIDTNSGFLRFARASAGGAVWIANTPPEKTIIPVSRYLQVICDAAIVGARWVLALDSDFDARLLKGEPEAAADWKRIAAHLKFFEDHKEWRAMPPYGQLAIVQDVSSGGLLSGGILDMIAVKHTPVRPIPPPRLSDSALQGAKMAVDVNPSSLPAEGRQVLQKFTRDGGTLLTAPAGWKFPTPPGDQITLDETSVKTLDDIWKEVNSLTGRRNLGARLFNVSSMLSNLVGMPDGTRIVLHLVNYSGYPVDSVTVHVLGDYGKAALYSPGGEVQKPELYKIEEGTGIEVDRIATVGTLVLEK